MTDEILYPDLPIVDAHHHLYPSNHWGKGAYLVPEYATDIGGGHAVVSTVYVECSQLYRSSGPERLQTSGEVEFAAVMGRLADTGAFGAARICAAIVGSADLTLGDAVDEVLDALDHAGDGRLRGVRGVANWDSDPRINASKRSFAPQGLLAEPDFRRGVARLADRGLTYDAWQYFPQLGELGDLAAAVSDAIVVCNHCGGLVGKHAYAGPDNFQNWKAKVQHLAAHDNVFMKLGGLANARTGFEFEVREERASTADLVRLWSPYIETCIEAFGPERCMFESNFPVDMIAADYRTLWNVYKQITNSYSHDERRALFSGTAQSVYRLK